MEIETLLQAVTDAAREAGRIMRSADRIAESVSAKDGHANYVTEYDKRVQTYLFSALSKALPEAAFIGEENGADAVTEESRRGWAFCVDPIDGTSNFVMGYRPSVTSIALLRNGTPFLGVVYNPYADLMFSAVRGRGARLNGTPILSSPAPLAQSLICFGTAAYYPELAHRTFRLCEYYLPRCVDLRRSGAAAWDFCTAAMGSIGLFFELRMNLWDYAAGALIAEEAGCRVTDIDGLPLAYDGPASILCASRGAAREAYFPDV